MATIKLDRALLTLALLLVACPSGGTDDDVGDGGTDGDGDGDTTTSDTGDGDAETTDSADTTGDGDGESTDGESTDGESTDGGSTDGESTDGESTDGESTDSESTEGETTGDGDGDGDCSGAGVGVCNDEPPTDGFTVDGMTIVGDCLEIDVSYSGGCADHTFSSCWDQSFAESDPVQAWLWIEHDSMNDPCDAIVQDTWTIDLSAMKQAWQEAYQSQSGTIILHVAGKSIDYDF